jgi:hypothetical protein
MSKWRLIDSLAIGDQRLFERLEVATSDRFYLADNSGYEPDRTDDGPLRINQQGTIFIATNYCSVPVFVERDNDRGARVGISHEALPVLFRHLAPHGACPYIRTSEEMNGLLAALKVLECAR